MQGRTAAGPQDQDQVPRNEEMPRIPSVSDTKAEPIIKEEDGGVHEDALETDVLDREGEQHGANQNGVGKS